MEIGIVSVPKAKLYELSYEEGSVTDRSLVADEVLSGWAVGIIEKRGKFLKVVTHYGYEGLLEEDSLLSASESRLGSDIRTRCRMVCSLRADLMNIPSVRGKTIQTVFAGSFVFIKDDVSQNGYFKVLTADGTCGFLPSVSIGERRDSDEYLLSGRPKDYFLHQIPRLSQSQEALREEVTLWAKRFLTTQYRWGGKTANGIDCSGLTFMSYFLSGILIYRDAHIQMGYPVKKISIDDKKKGDLLFFPGHVAIYLGNEQYIHATAYEKNFCCVINSLSPKDANYRPDLAMKLEAVGSVFA